MKRHPIKLMSLAAALASLGGTAAETVAANATTSSDTQANTSADQMGQTKLPANTFINTGTDLFGYIITRNSDGMIIAQTHHSHASHASHASHYSSR